eukprot:TRINITY_DN57238_c0_g1_i2.p2 TRINITY_DN57238_c0_g1~~TRINITY_DN57238_c0_g1_i2.p2  ORF type:complete len:109 (+),score=19.90 TRINITY_DN57238_c0_g1_i2:354-680(+)
MICTLSCRPRPQLQCPLCTMTHGNLTTSCTTICQKEASPVLYEFVQPAYPACLCVSSTQSESIKHQDPSPSWEHTLWISSVFSTSPASCKYNRICPILAAALSGTKST